MKNGRFGSLGFWLASEVEETADARHEAANAEQGYSDAVEYLIRYARGICAAACACEGISCRIRVIGCVLVMSLGSSIIAVGPGNVSTADLCVRLGELSRRVRDSWIRSGNGYCSNTQEGRIDVADLHASLHFCLCRAYLVTGPDFNGGAASDEADVARAVEVP